MSRFAPILRCKTPAGFRTEELVWRRAAQKAAVRGDDAIAEACIGRADQFARVARRLEWAASPKRKRVVA